MKLRKTLQVDKRKETFGTDKPSLTHSKFVRPSEASEVYQRMRKGNEQKKEKKKNEEEMAKYLPIGINQL